MIARNSAFNCFMVLAYLASAWGPALHGHIEAAPAHWATRSNESQVELFTSTSCPHPCNDPAHEHAPHDPLQCLLCQCFATVYTALPTVDFAFFKVSGDHRPLHEQTIPSTSRKLPAISIRGPPSQLAS